MSSPRLTRRRGGLPHPEALSPCTENLSQGVTGEKHWGLCGAEGQDLGCGFRWCWTPGPALSRFCGPWHSEPHCKSGATLLTLQGHSIVPGVDAASPLPLLRMRLWLPQEVTVLAASRSGPHDYLCLRVPAALSLFWALGCQLGWEGPAPHPHPGHCI